MKRIVILAAALLTVAAAIATERHESQKPLYILHGEVIDAERFNAIDSEEVESMTIIRDEERLRKFERFGDTSNGVIVITLKSRAGEDETFIHAEIMPSFMGGDVRTFQNWVMESIRYPQEAIERGLEDNIVATFVVNREGYIATESISILQSKHAILVDEVKRVIGSSPRWTPAIHAGKNVAVKFVLPVLFQLPDKTTSVASEQPAAATSSNQDSKIELRDEIVVRAFKDNEPAEGRHPLYIIDGKPCSYEAFKALPTTKIKMITLIKDEDETLRYYRDFGDTSNGVLFIHTKSDDPRVEAEPDTLPTFLGNDIATFQQWIAENAHYPAALSEQKLMAHIIAKCIINNLGYIEIMEISTIKGTPHQLFDEEVRRVIFSSPRWNPATKGGEAVAYEITIPILFGAME